MSEPVCIGVDVGRSELVVARATTNSERTTLERVPNSAAAIKRWLGTLPAGCRIGMEATGAYHRLVANMAHAGGHAVFVFIPRDVALCLRSLRTRGKTDVLDPTGIACFVRNEPAQCHPYVPPTPVQQRIATLIAKLDAQIKATIAQDAARQSGRRRLMSILGTGPLVGAALCSAGRR